MADAAFEQRLAAIWRIESASVIAGLTRMTRDVGAAEDLAQDALVLALERWPVEGVPEKPGAWLTTVAKRRAIDRLRRERRLETTHARLGAEIDEARAREGDATNDSALDDDIGDDVLRLIFTTCHPALSPEARSALTLRLLGGLTTAEIARAYLVPEPTISQRIVRAKKTLTEVRAEFETPRGDERAPRLASVLEVLYLVFNEGYTASAGDDWMRPALCDEAIRLGRVLANLAPEEPEVHGLLALMELQASRTAARTNAAGEPVLLLEQDRSRWDRLLVRRGLAGLARAESLATEPGPYALQAAIAACHARAAVPGDTDWARIAALYEALLARHASPIVALNHSVAVAMAHGPAAALPLVDALREAPALRSYHLLPSVRGDLLFKLGRHAEARAEFERAAALAHNARERELLLARAAAAREAGA
jgi:RNA polymerase sigma factor (sigma-70 family)